jgi:hypothetical protein
MCTSSCGGLFTRGVRLDEVTCPCGRGYWNVFRAIFITGDMIRDGIAPPREQYEAKIQAELPSDIYEAKIREQDEARIKAELPSDKFEAKIRQGFIRHFLSCKVKRARDDEVTKAGKNDGSSLRRAITEWWEYEKGDYESKGTSREFDVNTLKDTWAELSGSPKTDNDIRPLLLQQTSKDARPKPESYNSPPAQATKSSQGATRRHGPSADQTSPLPAPGGAEAPGKKIFVPEKDLRFDVLDLSGRDLRPDSGESGYDSRELLTSRHQDVTSQDPSSRHESELLRHRVEEMSISKTGSRHARDTISATDTIEPLAISPSPVLPTGASRHDHRVTHPDPGTIRERPRQNKSKK